MQAVSPAPASSSGWRSLWVCLSFWLTPPLLCLILYWPGFRAWFQIDDFAWLSLHQSVYDWRSFLAALFQPMAQGTIRPWSERIPFLLNWHLFGMSAVPLRALAFATMAANLALLAAFTRSLTGSKLAAFTAPILWICSGNIYVPMSWSSAYNQIQCALFLLTALSLWLRYLDTGRRGYYIGQFLVFVLGFGALEINVVYPALAALLAAARNRRFLWQTAPMFAVSIIYSLAHRAAAPASGGQIYGLYFDSSLPRTLLTYVVWAFGASSYADYQGLPVLPFRVAEAITGITLLVFAVSLLRRQQWLALFCVGWFFAVLAPVLPLKNHRMEYYLTIPLIGLSILGAFGFAAAWHRKRLISVLATVVALLYAGPSVWMARSMTREWADVSHRARTFLGSVAYARKRHPEKTLLIDGVDSRLFRACWWSRPFQLMGLESIFMPESAGALLEEAETPRSHFLLPDTLAAEAFRRGDAVAYEVVDGARLRNITEVYGPAAVRRKMRLPTYLNIADRLSSIHLKDGWWQPEGNHRWTAKTASLELRGPDAGGANLLIRGFRAPAQPDSGPVHLAVSVDGVRYRPSRIMSENAFFEFRYPLPDTVTGAPSMTVKFEVDRPAVIAGDGRTLGVAFGTIDTTR